MPHHTEANLALDEMLDNVCTNIPSLHKLDKHFHMQEWMMTEGAFHASVTEGPLSIDHVSMKCWTIFVLTFHPLQI